MSNNISAKTVMQAYIDGFNSHDAEALTALFAPDAVIQDPVGSPIKQGKEIAEWFRQGVAMNARLELDTAIRGSHANAAAMAFRVHMLQDGKPLTIRSLDTIEINQQGLITCLNAYWGPDDIEATPQHSEHLS